MDKRIVNYVLFQFGWLSCVYSAAAMQPWIGLVIAVLIIIVHINSASQPRAEIALISVAMVIGVFWDSLLISNGWLVYSSGILVENTAPYWIVAIWALFASTLNLSMNWLRGRFFLAAVTGAVAGPLSYYAGQKMGAVTFIDLKSGMLALAIGWSLFLPWLLGFSTYLNRYFFEKQCTEKQCTEKQRIEEQRIEKQCIKNQSSQKQLIPKQGSIE